MDFFDTEGLDLSVVGLVSGGHFLSHFFLLAFPPLFPILRAEFSLSNVELGLIVSAIQVGTFLQVFAGDLVDRVGGKRVFVLGMVVTSLGVGLAGIAGSYVLLLLFALVSSVGQAAFHPADYALLGAASSEESVGKSFGLHNFAGSLGFAAGPAVVGGIALVFDWHVALLAASALGLGYALLAHFLLDEVYLAEGAEADADEEERSGRVSLRDPTLLALLAFFFAISLGGIGIQAFTTVLVVDGFGLGEVVGNSTLTAFFTLVAFGVLVGGPISDRFRPHVVIVSVMLASAVLTWTVAAGLIPPVPAVLIGLFALLGGIFGLCFPSRDRLVRAASARGSTGRSFGFVFTGITVAAVVGPATLGAIIDTTTVWNAFWLIGASWVLAAGIALAITSDRVKRVGASAGEA